MESPSPLDDPAYAPLAWRRFRRIFAAMALVSAAAAGAAIGVLWYALGPLPIHMTIATAAGVFFTVLLAAALMGLMFLSSGSGHDAAVDQADLRRDNAAWHDDPRH